MKIFTSEEIKTIDRNTIKTEGITALDLVERAAAAITCEIISRWRPNKRIAVFAGPGNNGADALAVTRMLIEQGYRPEVFLFNIGENRLSPECAACRDRLTAIDGIDFTEITSNFSPPYLSSNDLVIDGLFGSGLRDPLTGGFKTLVQYINESGASIVSIDVPSGLFGEWNAHNISRNIIHATLTLSIQFPRLSFFIADNAPLIGEWKVLDIELSADEIRDTPAQYHLVERSHVRRALRRRDEFASKADFGSAMIVAGSYGMMGAAVLAAKGALRAGAGKVSIHTARCGFSILQSSVPEALFDADRNDIVVTDISLRHDYSAVALGPGLGTNEITVNALEAFLRQAKSPIILDADALNCVAERPTLLNHLPVLSVITPHAGEFDRIFGPQSSAEARLLKAVEMSHYYNILILLKGHYSALVRPDGKIYFNSTGNPGMATAGSGDVLTGVICSLMAQGYKPEISAIIGTYIHGLAGDMAAEKQGQYGVTAGDIAANIGRAIRDIMA